MTLSDLEWLFHIKFCFFCADMSSIGQCEYSEQLVKLKTGPYYQRHKSSAGTSFWRCKVYVDILVVLWKEGVK